jgi:hypothetical protein
VKNGRWQEIERLYNSALERRPEERAAYLNEICHDESLRKEVESLLACQSEAKGFIESPALEAAAWDLARNPASGLSADRPHPFPLQDSREARSGRHGDCL